jgi:hypothetical protein
MTGKFFNRHNRISPLILLSFIGLALALQSCGPSPSTPSLKKVPLSSSKNKETGVKEQKYDLGEVKQGKSYGHTFEFVNNTQKTLQLLQHRIPCGCAAIKMFPKHLKPGEKAKIRIKMDTKKYKGRIDKAFYVFTNSKEIPVITFHLTAKVIPPPAPICSVKAFIDIHSVSANKEYPVTFKIKNTGNKPLLIEEKKFIRNNNIHLITKLPVTISPAKAEKFDAVITSPETPGKFFRKLIFKTNDPHNKSLMMLIKGEVSSIEGKSN